MSDSIPGRYYGGNAKNLGLIAPLQQSDWRTLVREIFSQPVILNVTRAHYARMPKAERDKVKRVPFIVPCALKPGISERRFEHVEHCDLLALDIDAANDAAPIANNPEILRSALSPHPFVAYTTASSTDAAPRVRIIVAAHRIPVAGYKNAIQYLVGRLGLRAVTPESLVCVQPMFLPCLFSDEDEAIHNPLLITQETGDPVTADVSPEGVIEVSSRKTPSTDASDPLDFLTPRMHNITLAEVTTALTFISPDVGYAQWLSVAASLRHQFSQDSAADAAAFALFDEWSAKGSKYSGIEETRAKWASLVPNPTSRAPVTLRSLFHLAVEGGMSPAELAQKSFKEVKQWLEEYRPPAQLMREGIKLIASAPLLDPLERLVLLKTLSKELSRAGMSVSFADLKTRLKKLEARLGYDPDAKVAPLPDGQLPPWARGMAYVASDDEFFVRASGRRFNPRVLDSMYGVQLMGGEKEPGDSGKPTVRPQDFLLNIMRIPRVDGYRYDPANPHEVFLFESGQRYINTYLPLYPEAEPAHSAEAEDVITKHASLLIGEPEYASILLDWCCCLVQRPGQKIRWAPLLQGAMGSGKTVFAEMMRMVLGPTNVKLVDGNTLFDKFTGWSSGSQLAVLEEIRVIGTGRHQVMNMLKPRIANDRITVRRMQVEAVEEPNMTNYLILTNHQDAIAPSEDERRYFVIFSALQTREQVQAIPREYYKTVYDTVLNKAGGVRHFLENRKISAGFDPNGHAPVTKYLLEMLGASASPLASSIKECLEDGDHPLVKNDLVSVKSLRSVLDTHSLEHFSDQAVMTILREQGFHHGARISLDGSRHAIWTHRTRFKGDAETEAVFRLNGGSGSV